MPNEMYAQFYSAFMMCLRERLGKEKVKDMSDEDLWDLVTEDSELYKQIFRKTSYDSYHFLRKKKEMVEVGEPIIPIHTALFCNVVQLIMKLSLPKVPVGEDPEVEAYERRLNRWAPLFVNKHFPEHPEYLEYLLPKRTQKPTLKGSPSRPAEKHAIPSTGTADDLELAVACVEAFYKYLAVERTRDAWDLLSVKFKKNEVFKGRFKRFHDGYTNTRALRDIRAFNPVRTAPSIIECKVYYEDEMSIYPINGLHEIRLLHVNELETFTSVIKKMEHDIIGKGGENFGNIKMSKIFEPTGAEYIWWECGLKKDMLHKVFPKPHTHTVPRLSHCYCIVQNGKCFINDIKSLMTYAIR